MTPWESYEAFMSVVSHGSFTDAARSLNVSKSVVSRHISQLENRLGSQLLLRTTRSLSTTDIGRDLYQQCLEVFGRMREIELHALECDGVPKGRMRIAALDYFGENYVAPAAAEMMQTYSGLDIEISISSEPRDIVASSFDLSILYSDLKSSSYMARKIYDLNHTIVASPRYLEQHGRPQHPDDLRNHACLVSTYEACATWSFFIAGQKIDYNPESRWRSNSGVALMSAARTGIGLARLPGIYLRPYLETGELVPLLEEFKSVPMPVWAVYAYNRRPSANLRIFLDLLVDRLARIDPKADLIPCRSLALSR
jgi:DNA-binding transcriptional LysR family regulator